MIDLKAQARKLLDKNVPTCLVRITETQGSTPREAGACMLVTEKNAYGSIGGGNLEFTAIARARKMLTRQGRAEELSYILGPDMEQCCGGQVKIAMQILDNVEEIQESISTIPVYIFGAGHVGTALVRALRPLPFDLHCLDRRPEKYQSSVQTLPVQKLDGVEAVVARAPDAALFIVMTHDHALDYEIVKAVLEKGRFGFLGLIGSKTKKARFIHRLTREGIAPARIRRLTCPIGIDGIRGKQPEIIATSVAAQLLQIKDKLEREI